MKQYTPEELNQLSKEEIVSLLMQSQNEAARFKERLEELQMHLFGRSTERLECLGQLSAFNEAEIVCDEEEKEPEIEDAVVARSKRPRGKLADHLEMEGPVTFVSLCCFFAHICSRPSLLLSTDRVPRQTARDI